jgi:hypothetical protein
MKRKVFFKTAATLIVATFFIILAVGTGESNDCPPELADRKCPRCGKHIGCYGYQYRNGLLIGPDANLPYCSDCAKR